MDAVWSFVDKWLLTCWPGIDCGDAGGWASGIGALAVLVFTVRQVSNERKTRAAEKRNREDALGAVLMEDLFAVLSRCRTWFDHVHMIKGGTQLRARMLLERANFEELQMMQSIRSALPDLPIELRVPMSQLLTLMRNVNSNVLSLTRQLSDQADGNGLEFPLDEAHIHYFTGLVELVSALAFSAARVAGRMRFDDRPSDYWQLEEWEREIEQLKKATAKAPGKPGA